MPRTKLRSAQHSLLFCSTVVLFAIVLAVFFSFTYSSRVL